jgi:ribosomal protein S18 acetylase RimI-like enzyme
LTGWSAEQKTAFCRQQYHAQTFHYRKYYPSAQFLVIERDGVQIGRLFVDRWENEIRIIDISLLTEFRRGGVGTSLLLGLQEEAREGKKTLTIHVEQFNPARRLYDRLGFREIEINGIYWLMEWRA